MELPNTLRRQRGQAVVAKTTAITVARAAAMVTIVVIAGSSPAHARDASSARAQRLFAEGAGARASLRGDTQALPPSVARCAGCHDRGEVSASRRATGAEAAPRLDAATLLHPASRRRGPPSRYDESSFCRLLETGVDPAGVIVARAMPVYSIEAGDCRALWQVLISPPS